MRNVKDIRALNALHAHEQAQGHMFYRIDTGDLGQISGGGGLLGRTTIQLSEDFASSKGNHLHFAL